MSIHTRRTSRYDAEWHVKTQPQPGVILGWACHAPPTVEREVSLQRKLRVRNSMRDGRT